MLLLVAGFHSFSKLSSSPSLCVCVCVCVRTCARSPHVFFLFSSADGGLGYFHILAVVNSAVVNTGVLVSSPISVFVLFR